MAESHRGIPSCVKIYASEKLNLMKKAVLFLIRGYKSVFSPILGQHCRYHPTCSIYTYEAIEKYGLLKGMILGTKRLLRCHPFRPGGVDHVP
jgi:putative membrane protein insertion efficiency factor